MFSNGCKTLSKLPKKFDTWIIRKIVGSPVIGVVKKIAIDEKGNTVFVTLESCGRKVDLDEELVTLLTQWGKGNVVENPKIAINQVD